MTQSLNEFANKFVNEADIALKTLSNKKPGTPREYPVTEFNPNLTDEEKIISKTYENKLAGE